MRVAGNQRTAGGRAGPAGGHIGRSQLGSVGATTGVGARQHRQAVRSGRRRPAQGAAAIGLRWSTREPADQAFRAGTVWGIGIHPYLVGLYEA